jgi:hypothetical protein
MFEAKNEPVISKRSFASRIMGWGGVTFGLVAVSLAVGMAGYHYLENMPWIDALLNASMILGGMGEVDPLRTDAGKIFASVYALYSGFFLIICGGLFMAPIFHRVLHRFHSE